MTDLLGPASAVNSVTTEPADSRTFGSSDTFFKDCSSSTAQDGTAIGASWLNGWMQQLRNAIRGMGITVNNTNTNMLLQAIQAAQPPFAADTGGTPGQLVVNLNLPGYTVIAGTRFYVQIANTVPGATTIALSNGSISYGTLNVTRPDKSALNTYDLVQGQIAEMVYDGTEVQIAKPLVNGSTGDVVLAGAGSTKTGHVALNGFTIGNASSAATALASPLAQSLFTFLWNNYSNTLCPVSSGRGASAAADFAANKTIQLPDAQCKGLIGVDGMAGAVATNRLTGVPVTAGAANTPGSTLGEALHTLTTTELAAHNHGITDPGHAHGFSPDSPIVLGTGGDVGLTESGTGGESWSVTNTTSPAMTGISVNNAGGGGAHNNTPLSLTVVAFMRL